MATVEDLIATISGGVHVSQEGYDLKALQSHLAQTLYQTLPQAQPAYHYQPVASAYPNFPPPAPATSLNSMDSLPSDSAFPAFANNTSPTAKQSSRPQVTPIASFRGFAPQQQHMSHVNTTREPPSPPLDVATTTIDTDTMDSLDDIDYEAFKSDAFAPVYADNAANNKPGNPWGAFGPSAFGNSGAFGFGTNTIANGTTVWGQQQPQQQQPSSGVATPTTFGFGFKPNQAARRSSEQQGDDDEVSSASSLSDEESQPTSRRTQHRNKTRTRKSTRVAGHSRMVGTAPRGLLTPPEDEDEGMDVDMDEDVDAYRASAWEGRLRHRK